MPDNWLAVPHFQQELDYSCAAACARMVLAHFGDSRTEGELRTLFDTDESGTRAGNLMRLSSPTFEVFLRRSSVAELQASLARNEPVVVFLMTGALDYWTTDIPHTAVVVAVDGTTVTLNDPYFATSPQTTSLESFENAWASTDQFAAFVRPRRKP